MFYVLLLLIVAPFIGKASGYWLDIKGNGKVGQPVQIQVCYGNIDEYSIRHRDTGAELTLTGDFKIMVIDEKGQRTQVAIKKGTDCWEGSFTPKEKGVYQILGINTLHPVLDRSKIGGNNVLPVDYLCAAYQVESIASVSKPAQPLDIIVAKKGRLINVKAFNNGIPASNTTKLRVFNPENWEKELSVNDKGEAVFAPTIKGLYVIRQDWVHEVSGTYKGVSYSSVRYRCNYCLQVP